MQIFEATINGFKRCIFKLDKGFDSQSWNYS